MQIERKRISDLNRATYNPRIDLIPGDPEYENLRRSITTYGLLIPVIWNKRTNNVVGGHQRLTVLENEGETEVDVSVVDLDPMQERQLNVALNKIEGGWDEEKLGALLAELGDDATLTGFNQQEIDSLTNDIDSLIDDDTVDEEFIYHDLFHTPGFVYEKQQKMRIGGVKLHPQYEAKTMKYLIEHDLNTENALFWIVGAEPRER